MATRPDRRPDDVDDSLRRALEPRPLAVERVVRGALAGKRPPGGARWWPRLAVTAAVMALLVVLLPDSAVQSPVPEPATPEPVRISISNVEGYVTVSSTAGSQWILVPGDDS